MSTSLGKAMNHFIRQIGDAVLQSKVPAFDWQNKEELNSLLQIMEKRLIEAGGVGIACNQCAEIAAPKAVVIVGTFDEALKTVAKARYPDRAIPDAMVMVNPKIQQYKGETYYPGEGCLSVKGGLRGRVQRYSSILVSYQDEKGQQHEKTCQGFIAHIIQHECDHLNGIVYLQKILADLSAEQFLILKECIQMVLAENNHTDDAVVVAPTMVFDRDQDDVVFERDVLLCELKKMDREIVYSIKAELDNLN